MADVGLAVALLDHFDDEEEMFLQLLDELVRPKKNREFPYWEYAHFNLERVSKDDCLAQFRFEKGDLPRLLNVLPIPDKVVCPNGTIADGMEALCIMLRRLAYPCRLGDVVPLFGRSAPELSLISSEIVDHISNTFGNLLSSLGQPWLSQARLQSYADAIYAKSMALENCWGFIDGTLRPICRPIEGQRVVYSGHKRVHGLKFQAVSAADGMIAHLFGPAEGKRHDSAVLRMSGLMAQLEQYSFGPGGEPLCIYGDSAYPHRVQLQTGYQNNDLSPEEQLFNKNMNRLRTSVEWTFGDVATYFAFTDFKKKLKIGLSPVGAMYRVAALMHNAKTCLYGSFTSKYMEIEPPNLEEYFNLR